MKDPNTLFAALFEPKRIALIGASADETKTTSRPQRFLRKHGFKGEILPVNPSRTEILGDKAYKDVNAISGDIDHAYILLNGKGAVEALAACGKRGVKVASILAGGFADAGEAGASLQDDLPEKSRASAFGRSESVLQLAWVAGGAMGVLVYTDLWVGFTGITAVLIVGLAQTVVSYFGESLIPGFGGNRPVLAEQEGGRPDRAAVGQE